MSKEEFLKIQTCVLKVHIHCDGCKHKVKKTRDFRYNVIFKIQFFWVYKFSIDSEQGKVTVSGNVDASTLIKKLTKNGKHAELWGAPKANNNQQIATTKDIKLVVMKSVEARTNEGQRAVYENHQQPRGKGSVDQPINCSSAAANSGSQDMKLPQMKGLNMPLNNNNNKGGGGQDQKSLKFKVPDDDDEFESMDDILIKMKPPQMGNSGGGPKMPNMVMHGGQMPNMANMMKNGGQMPNMQNMMKNGGQHPMLMKGANGAGGGAGANGGNSGGNGKKGGGGNIPVQMNIGGGNNNGKKGGDNQNQGGGKNGGGQPPEGKNGGGGGGQNKNGGGGNIINGNGAKKGGPMNDEFEGMPNMMVGMNTGGGNGGGPMTNMPMGHMGQMGQMGNNPMGQIPAVQGLPAGAPPGMIGGGGGNPGGYFQGGGPQAMPGNPYYHQQLEAAMMNQPRAIPVGNDRFQPMMYARPPPETNYMPPYHPYGPYPPPTPHDPYGNYFNDDNTSSCSVM
ncbi:hypothetical protein Leryth_003761 [Lithospermum erythrorhizon]|nr:hypothetical protein Leryth_003761 [Lithospermum erythrorhizon]